MSWNNDWREELEKDFNSCYIRLCECRNTPKDIALMAKLNYKYNQCRTKEECLDRIIEWVTDWNNQYNIDFTEEEYNEILKTL